MQVADVSAVIGRSGHDLTLKVYTHALMRGTKSSRLDQIAGLLPRNDGLAPHEFASA